MSASDVRELRLDGREFLALGIVLSARFTGPTHRIAQQLLDTFGVYRAYRIETDAPGPLIRYTCVGTPLDQALDRLAEAGGERLVVEGYRIVFLPPSAVDIGASSAAHEQRDESTERRE